MAQLKMTLGEIRSLVAAMYSGKKIADPTWTPGKEDISGLVNKIMAEVVIDGDFNDKLPELDGNNYPFGQAIEEYFTGLVPAQAFNDNESNASAAQDALKPYRPTFDQVVYSERFDRKKFKTTIDYDKYEVSLSDQAEVEKLTNLIMKRLYDSLNQWRYATKKGLLGQLAEKAIAAQAGTTYTTNSTVLKAGVIYVQSSKFYVSKMNYTAAVNKSLATLAAETPATVIEISPALVQVISDVADTDTAESFIKAVKDACENAQFVTEGTSLSGSTIGAEEGLVLFLKKGYMSVIEVDALAGAFQSANLAIPARIKVVDDFGTSTNANKIVAILADPRGIKLHNNYRAVRTDENGDGDYINYTLHNQDTGFISAHTFVKVFKTA